MITLGVRSGRAEYVTLNVVVVVDYCRAHGVTKYAVSQSAVTEAADSIGVQTARCKLRSAEYKKCRH